MNKPLATDLDLPKLAHDLRGPLMPLRTAAWLLRTELGESPRALELAGIVERQSDRLARMMDELSDWARSIDAHAALQRTPITAALALDMAIGAVPGCVGEARYVGEVGEQQVQADPHRLAQLLATLIQHAMHRNGGEAPDIEVSVQHALLQICVGDRGAAMGESERQALLEGPLASPFDQGLGLRLLIARRIAEAHGGSLAADESPGGGLVLRCCLPLIDSPS